MTTGFQHILTVDGPSGSGKTTLLAALSQRYGCLAIEIGPVVRAVAWFAELHDLTISDAVAAIAGFQTADRLQIDPSRGTLAASEVSIAGHRIPDRVFGGELRPAIAATSLDADAMAWIFGLIRATVRDTAAIVSGREAATVCPGAGLSIRLEAAADVRAQRKERQLAVAGLGIGWVDDLPLLGAPLPRQIVIDTTDESRDAVARRTARRLERGPSWRPLRPTSGIDRVEPPPTRMLARWSRAVA